MIARSNCMDLVLETVPRFTEAYQHHLYEWRDDPLVGLCLHFSAFTEYTKHLIEQRATDELAIIFALIETLLQQGDQDVQDAAATCFLENLLNVTPDTLDPAAYIPLLGVESRAFCRAWDEWTGVKTPGLWSDADSARGKE